MSFLFPRSLFCRSLYFGDFSYPRATLFDSFEDDLILESSGSKITDRLSLDDNGATLSASGFREVLVIYILRGAFFLWNNCFVEFCLTELVPSKPLLGSLEFFSIELLTALTPDTFLCSLAELPYRWSALTSLRQSSLIPLTDFLISSFVKSSTTSGSSLHWTILMSS